MIPLWAFTDEETGSEIYAEKFVQSFTVRHAISRWHIYL
jgi:hypothetical protein